MAPRGGGRSPRRRRAVLHSWPLLAEGRLSLVLERLALAPVPVQFVYPLARLLAPKIRAFVDFAAPWLRQRLAQGCSVRSALVPPVLNAENSCSAKMVYRPGLAVSALPHQLVVTTTRRLA
jgi:hypothetical protein